MDNANNWIDSLTPPKERGNYLVYINRYPGETFSKWIMKEAEFNGDTWVVNHQAVITHYMPLPKPPGEL